MKKITLLFLTCAISFFVFGQAPKKVLVEDQTGTWCGWCPGGRTAAEDIEATLPNAICVANHRFNTSDSYECSYTKNIDAAINTYGYPGGMVDRKLFSGSSVVIDISQWKPKAQSQLTTLTPVAVSITSNYNSSTRVLDVTVNANFVGAYTCPSGTDLRISCLLVEDSLVNTSDPQHNYYGSGCSTSPPASPWNSYPCSMPTYIQRDVVRANLAPDWGTAGVIPATIPAGSIYSKTYSYTIPTTYNNGHGVTNVNVSHMSIVAFVSKYATAVTARDVMNVSKVYVGSSNATAIEEKPELTQVVVKQNTPNPFRDMTALQFTLNTTDNVVIKVYNTFGQVVNDIYSSKLVPGDHTFYWGGTDNSGSLVTPGVYYYTISTSSQKVTKPMIFLGQ
jgi:hypothetical protein